ncbi:hypothetical protein Tco_0114742 [Tanacetum coccineum]
MVDDLQNTRIGYATRTALESYTNEFEKKAQEERKLYIDVVEKSVKDIINDEVKSLLPHILPKEVSDFATLVIQSTINESLENVILAKSSSQPKSEEPVFETADTEMQQDHGGDTKDQPNVEDTLMDDWFKKPNKTLTPDRPWNYGKSIDSRPP